MIKKKKNPSQHECNMTPAREANFMGKKHTR